MEAQRSSVARCEAEKTRNALLAVLECCVKAAPNRVTFLFSLSYRAKPRHAHLACEMHHEARLLEKKQTPKMMQTRTNQKFLEYGGVQKYE